MPTVPLTKAMLDAQTPNDVNVTTEAREPIWDATLGIAVQPTVWAPPPHRLVTIGDSITQGFQSGAIYNTDLSYPAIIAHEMGWLESFRRPHYPGFGGLPLNIEFLLRDLEQRYGKRIDWWELAAATFRIDGLMAQIEDYWERGPGSRVPNIREINHNLAIYGWDLRDCLSLDADLCRAAITQPKTHRFLQLVENANERTALRVLDSARDSKGKALSPLGAAKALSDEGAASNNGIETLIVMLGANNVLGTVTSLQVVWSDTGYDDLEKKQKFTVWRPQHFEAELKQVVAEVSTIRARHVIWATVPHVTIAPIARGVDRKVRIDSRYFPFYTRPWISDRDFDAKDDPCITEQQARAVDSAIDQYNTAIVEAVRDARTQGRDWLVFDLAGLLDRLAARRYLDSVAARPDWWQPYDLPWELRALDPVPDSRFFTSGPQGRTRGGLFSLDGVHPTTISYGIVAQEIINIMQGAGVKFLLRDGKTERIGPVKIDFNRLIAQDTLISDPPISIVEDLKLFGWFDQKLDFVQRMLRTTF